MVETIRKDVFQLPPENPIAAGHYLLRTTVPDSSNHYLNQILIKDDVYSPKPNSQCITGVVRSSGLLGNISDGDIGVVNANGTLRVILSRNANHNTVLVTERCNNRCLFCSQPPKERDDDHLLVQAGLAIAAFQSDDIIGISGGEPLLYREKFLRFLDFVILHAPSTSLHILSNGRAFSDTGFASEIAKRCQDTSITFGIPLYSILGSNHDRLVGAHGAYRDTINGLINAGNLGIPIELRIIPTQQNYKDISTIVEFSSRCLSNIVQVSIMNLEPTGWAKNSWHNLYLSPSSYLDDLRNGIEAAIEASLPVCLFNFPLCHIPEDLWPYAVQSISDWKNYYPNECSQCQLKSKCPGYFTSSRGKFHHPPRRIEQCVNGT
ncbi:His-Xaa-Ser system radical SAM maturase HxsC [Hahella sp. CCB-MM4]|uniref:His-Xaa-Ser system radical SAM maturase HxsC n=1 Tax=Hahella sp. (strain CCB-MM4) TaxID=1926491 RepID=UPI000B9BE0A3|nr:His-Xaa-Ser system radical SAM maturase HxsC [Hahella sp. CCB-MM4]OZG70868.1 His-Xaa-Ser system radical SAM maturase HxsC [Hahella sp. CCB-MM4]